MTGPDHDPHRMVESERLLEVIRTQTDIVKQGLDLAGVMALVTERAQLLTGAQGGVVELVEGDEMIYSAATGIAESHPGLRLPRSTSISGLCVQQGVPLRCDDTETDARVNQEACRRIGLRSMIVVPLRHLDSTVGVIKVLAAKPAAFEDSDLRLLGLMADFIAASMFHAARLKQASRASDTVARLGGDEFGVILSRVDQADGAAIHLQRLVEKFAQPFQFEGRSIPLKASAGCALYPDHGTDINALMEHADQAMYQVKRANKAQAV